MTKVPPFSRPESSENKGKSGGTAHGRIAGGAGPDVYLAARRPKRHKMWLKYVKARIGALAVVAGVAGAWAIASVPAVEAQPKPLVSDIRAADSGDKTRIVLALDRAVSFTVFPLADPYRVVIDLPEVGWQLPPQPLPSNVGLVDKLRYGLFQPGTTRVVLDMKGPIAIAQAFWLEADSTGRHRLVVDVAGTSRDFMIAGLRQGTLTVDAGAGVVRPAEVSLPRAAALTPPPAPALRPAAASAPAANSAIETTAADTAALALPAEPVAAPFGAPPQKPQSSRPRGKRVIVVDPGHGGPDPGTIGASGTYEKNVTLAMAREIKEHLEKTGRYKVVLTRDRDIFLRLRERVAIAREANADLFMSIHADSMPDRAARGPSIYTLSEKASDREAADLADKENKADVIAGLDLSHETPEVSTILIDLAQRETMNRSAQFASGLIGEIRKETAVLRNTHRFAGFAVLKAPDVPSVLVELGFLSNKAEEKALTSRKHRARLAQAVVRSTDAFFSRVEEAKRP